MKELNECVSRNGKKLEKIKVEKGRGSKHFERKVLECGVPEIGGSVL